MGQEQAPTHLQQTGDKPQTENATVSKLLKTKPPLAQEQAPAHLQQAADEIPDLLAVPPADGRYRPRDHAAFDRSLAVGQEQRLQGAPAAEGGRVGAGLAKLELELEMNLAVREGLTASG